MHAVAEIFLRWIARKVVERQDGKPKLAPAVGVRRCVMQALSRTTAFPSGVELGMIGIHCCLLVVHVMVERQSFLLLPSSHGARVAIQVNGDLFQDSSRPPEGELGFMLRSLMVSTFARKGAQRQAFAVAAIDGMARP